MKEAWGGEEGDSSSGYSRSLWNKQRNKRGRGHASVKCLAHPGLLFQVLRMSSNITLPRNWSFYSCSCSNCGQVGLGMLTSQHDPGSSAACPHLEASSLIYKPCHFFWETQCEPCPSAITQVRSINTIPVTNELWLLRGSYSCWLNSPFCPQAGGRVSLSPIWCGVCLFFNHLRHHWKCRTQPQ